MHKLTLSDVLLATGGSFIQGDLVAAIDKISTDTRTLAQGDFFVPLVGRRFDGHGFLMDALRKGACGCLVSSAWSDKTKFLSGISSRFGVVEVDDTNEAYGKIAAYYRNWFCDLSVIAVSGSNGKSTTKEMIARVLSTQYGVLKNEGTLNNLVGVPQTLLSLDWQTRIAVLEMGTSSPGEISKLVAIARPDVGVLTNIGPSHLEYFGDLDGVAKEKGMLAEGLTEKGLFVVHADDPRALAVCHRTKAKVIGFGFGPNADVRATEAVCDNDGRWSFTVTMTNTGEEQRLGLGVVGKHNILNALAAIAVASHYRIGLGQLKDSLKSCRGLTMRMELLNVHSVRVINDAYNSNPQSLAKAIEALDGIVSRGRKIVVLGDMLELGATERLAHEEAARSVASSSAAVLIAVGNRAVWAAETFAKCKRAVQEVYRFQGVEEAGKFMCGMVRAGDVVLLKGSRGMRLEQILDRMRLAPPPPASLQEAKRERQASIVGGH